MQKVTLASFRRITSSGRYLPEIDGLRFLASLSVVTLHCYAEWLARHGVSVAILQTQRGWLGLLGHGGYGVQVFFAISGFILALPFARHHLRGARPVSLGAYFLRRVTRLEPPYILWLLIRVALLYAATALPMRFLLLHFAASVFYAHNLIFAISSRIEAVSWTLEIEVQFYCLAPWLTSIYRIPQTWLRRTLLLVAIAAAAPLQSAFLPGWHGLQNAGAFNLSLLVAIQFFLVGLLVADLYVDGWERIPVSWGWDAFSLIFWPWMYWLQPHTFLFLGPLVLPVLFVGAFKGKVMPSILRCPLISVIGGMCYSIYLTHRTTVWLSLTLLQRFHFRGAASLGASLLLGIVSSIIVGAVYFRLIERPCMDPSWPRKLMARFRSDPPGPGHATAATNAEPAGQLSAIPDASAPVKAFTLRILGTMFSS